MDNYNQIRNQILIQTALLALQQTGLVDYGNTEHGVEDTGFHVSILREEWDISERPEASYNILVYLTDESPTGFAVRVTADYFVIPAFRILDRNIESFKDFQQVTKADYSEMAYEKVMLYKQEIDEPSS